MNDRDLILHQLERIIEQRGGKKPTDYEKRLGKIDKNYKNQFEEEDSIGINYIDLLYDVTRQIAMRLNSVTLKEVTTSMIKAVPQKAIDIVMDNLKKGRDIDIKKLVKADKEAEKYLDEIQEKRGLAKYQFNLKKAKTDMAKYKSLKYPGMTEIETEYNTNKSNGKDNNSLIYDDAVYKDLLTYQGSGKKKRKESAYNKFVKEYFKKHKGATMKEAAQAWTK